jgi:Dyp-type peroxidase family
MRDLAPIDLDDIQGDVLIGLQKNAESFVFFKIVDNIAFRRSARLDIISRVTNARLAQRRDDAVAGYRATGQRTGDPFLGLNLGFTKEGLERLLGKGRPKLDPSFERGADHPETVKALHDPDRTAWLSEFVAERIDGVLLITGPNRQLVTSYRDRLLSFLGGSIKLVYSEIGTVRPGRARGHEHFGFLDGISQPGIRGLTPVSNPIRRPDQGLPGQDLIWPGEFVLGYPSQNPKDPGKPGPIPPLPTPWARNGSYMVFRRLEQMVPEFHRFVAAQAERLGIYPELLASRMVGRWRSGAPLVLAPRDDNPWLGADAKHNNDFAYAADPLQRACPYAAHIRKVNPRDDSPEGKAAMLTRRIIRAGIPFGPEVMPGESKTVHSRGLMFVCYQASIERQFEWIQARFANNPGFVPGKKRPDSGSPVMPGYDPIVGQAAGEGVRVMDEPAPNYPAGNRRTSLEIPEEFVKLTAAAYFFMPSLSALRTALTH